MHLFNQQSLPTRLPYLKHRNKKYQIIEKSEDHLIIKRAEGKVVKVRTSVIARCHQAITTSPRHTLMLQELPAGSCGESVVGAILVAANLAEVVDERPILLRS